MEAFTAAEFTGPSWLVPADIPSANRFATQQDDHRDGRRGAHPMREAAGRATRPGAGRRTFRRAVLVCAFHPVLSVRGGLRLIHCSIHQK